ncbi:MAG: Cytosolic Fe-S cluster assembly factor nar1 [Cirrosporium novae-zelandiae]|nr:MAG: Cytosolic Fe-S cluster assembly factor nar1 [Cirrosporium novae-zelandiae]
MSAILSADDLNDFISPGVACIKPVETLPKQPEAPLDPYQVTTEDKITPENLPPAQISLTDCLACSGCVTSAEAVLVSLQSHTEVLNALDSAPSRPLTRRQKCTTTNCSGSCANGTSDGKIFVASVSPQVRASLAATYGVSGRTAGYMIEQLLCGEDGLRKGGKYGNGFAWVVDTNIARQICLVAGADEVIESLSGKRKFGDDGEEAAKKPILSSACPGWICYAEKTHPHVLSHLSRLKSPQALSGVLLKSVLSHHLNIPPSKIFHLAIMPCFDKKLEASREELTSNHWASSPSDPPIRDVDCVITSREILTLATARNIDFSSLPRTPIPSASRPEFPDSYLSTFLFPQPPTNNPPTIPPSAGTSGGYMHHLVLTMQSLHPTSVLQITRGRNNDVFEYTLLDPASSKPIFKAARYYGFRNIQNLVRRLRPPGRMSKLPGAATAARRARGKDGGDREFAYVEVMACPGGCTNGGGQVRVEEVRGREGVGAKEWLREVDEAYYSASSSSSSSPSPSPPPSSPSSDETPPLPTTTTPTLINGIFPPQIHTLLSYWSNLTGIEKNNLIYTTYRKVESDVGKNGAKGGGGSTERVVELAGKIGGGW